MFSPRDPLSLHLHSKSLVPVCYSTGPGADTNNVHTYATREYHPQSIYKVLMGVDPTVPGWEVVPAST